MDDAASFQDLLVGSPVSFFPMIARVEEEGVMLDVVVGGKKTTFRVNGSHVKNVNTPALIPGT